MHYLLVENVIVSNKENKNIQESICAATSRVPKCLDRHDLSKRGVKKVNKCDYPFFQHRFRLVTNVQKNRRAGSESIEKMDPFGSALLSRLAFQPDIQK